MRLFPYLFRCFCVIDVLMTCDIFCFYLFNFQSPLNEETSNEKHLLFFLFLTYGLYYQNILRPISKMSKLGWLNFP